MDKPYTTKVLKIGFFFKPFAVPSHGQLLVQANLPPDEELIIVQCKGEYRALLAREMAYHHVAQGELADEPYLISF
jgi:hypothetical protein